MLLADTVQIAASIRISDGCNHHAWLQPFALTLQ
jgi:hypothetical protein